MQCAIHSRLFAHLLPLRTTSAGGFSASVAATGGLIHEAPAVCRIQYQDFAVARGRRRVSAGRGSPARPLTRSPAHPLTRSPAHPLIRSPARSPAHPLTHSSAHPLTRSRSEPTLETCRQRRRCSRSRGSQSSFSATPNLILIRPLRPLTDIIKNDHKNHTMLYNPTARALLATPKLRCDTQETERPHLGSRPRI